MINNERVVSVTTTDLISLYSVILAAAGTTVDAFQPTDIGIFGTPVGTMIATEPVVKVTDSAMNADWTLYFVPAYNFDGFYGENGKLTPEGADIVADGRSLYKAEYEIGETVTISKIGF